MSPQPDLFAGPPAARDTDTSRGAAASVAARAPRLRLLALQAIRAAGPIRPDGSGGLAADEVAARLKISVLTARPRVCELAKAGAIEDSGRRRRNASGRPAIVWIVKPEGDHG